jgi:dTMP kinase
MRGRFITFEGGEGSGKSSRAAALARRLRGHGIAVELTREPGGSPGAEIIRHVILAGGAAPLGAEAETLLFAAARDDHLRVTVLPALAAGHWVISDRFLDSTRAYQGALGRVDARLIRALERVTVGDAMPALTVILDVPAEVGLARATARRGDGKADRFEAEDLPFHQALRQAFLAIAAAEPQRCMVIDGTLPPEVVDEAIWEIVTARLLPPRGTAAKGVPEAATP